MAKLNEFDVVIVGAGPAGLSAAIYALRSGLSVACIEKNIVGGQVFLIERLENYPGFSNVSGLDLMKKFEEQAKSFGAKFFFEEVVSVSDSNGKKIVKTKKQEFLAKTVIVATGSIAKELGLQNERELKGKGVHYCAVCDGPIYKGKIVAVVGGGNSAIEEAIFLSRLAKKVFLIHRRSELRAEKLLQERASKQKNIEFLLETEIIGLVGEKKLEKLVLQNNKTKKNKELKLDALFVYVGRIPNTGFVAVKKNDFGSIVVDNCMRTSSEGIFAAGDCIEKCLHQIITSTSEGAIAAISARDYIVAKH